MSASGDGLRPSFSNRARKKLSTGVRSHFWFFTLGTSGRIDALNTQWLRGSLFCAAVSGQSPPWSIHARSKPICSGVSGWPFCGIRLMSGCVVVTTCINKLSALFPATNRGAGIASFQRGGPFVEPQAALLPFWPVTLETIGRENRVNITVEIRSRTDLESVDEQYHRQRQIAEQATDWEWAHRRNERIGLGEFSVGTVVFNCVSE